MNGTKTGNTHNNPMNTKEADRRSALVARIRDKMQFREAYFAGPIELRVYQTKRPGTYGYQFAAIAWGNDRKGPYYGPIPSEVTGGYGYDKIAHCTAHVISSAFECLEAHGVPVSPPPPRLDGGSWSSWDEYARGVGPFETLREAFRDSPEIEVIHAHG